MTPLLPSKLKETSSPLKPDITKEEWNDLPRVERIYQSLMYPRHFQLSSQDEVYLDMMRKAYNMMFDSATDREAQRLIKTMNKDKSLELSEVVELMRCTKLLFGRIDVRDVQFDRMLRRHQLEDIARRARNAGDIKNERLAVSKLIDLDRLQIQEAQDNEPKIPQLPEVIISSAEDIIAPESSHELAIIESQPHDEEE